MFQINEATQYGKIMENAANIADTKLSVHVQEGKISDNENAIASQEVKTVFN